MITKKEAETNALTNFVMTASSDNNFKFKFQNLLLHSTQIAHKTCMRIWSKIKRKPVKVNFASKVLFHVILNEIK